LKLFGWGACDPWRRAAPPGAGSRGACCVDGPAVASARGRAPGDVRFGVDGVRGRRRARGAVSPARRVGSPGARALRTVGRGCSEFSLSETNAMR
jgi:hypothetical protein